MTDASEVAQSKPVEEALPPAVTDDLKPASHADPDPASFEGPLNRLITVIERATLAGWAETARLIALLTVIAAAVALVIIATRR